MVRSERAPALVAGRLVPGADDRAGDDGRGDGGGQDPESEGGQPVPQRQVRPVVDVERGEHGGVGDPHAGDVAGVAGAVAAAVQVPGGSGRERHRAEDEQVVVPGPAHGGQADRGGEHGGDGPVVPAAGPDVPRAALASQRGGRAGDDGGQAGDDVDGEDGQEGGGGGAHLNAQDAAGGGHRQLPLTNRPICSKATY